MTYYLESQTSHNDCKFQDPALRIQQLKVCLLNRRTLPKESDLKDLGVSEQIKMLSVKTLIESVFKVISTTCRWYLIQFLDSLDILILKYSSI